MAGPTSNFARLFAAPGVPRSRAVRILPAASSSSFQTQQNLRIARQPAHFGANCRGLARIQCRFQRRANPIGAGVAAVDRAHMEATRAAVVALAGF